MEEEKKIIPRGPDLSDFEKGFIDGAHRFGAKTTEIIVQLSDVGYERSYKCVKNYVKKLKLNSNSPSKRINCGKKRSRGEETSKKIIEEVENNRLTTATQIQRNQDINHNHVGIKTIERFLNEKGYFARRMTKKPDISLSNKEKRLKWAEERKDWSQNDWQKIMFSDESLIQAKALGIL